MWSRPPKPLAQDSGVEPTQPEATAVVENKLSTCILKKIENNLT